VYRFGCINQDKPDTLLRAGDINSQGIPVDHPNDLGAGQVAGGRIRCRLGN
jgi:hypothetical protein